MKKQLMNDYKSFATFTDQFCFMNNLYQSFIWQLQKHGRKAVNAWRVGRLDCLSNKYQITCFNCEQEDYWTKKTKKPHFLERPEREVIQEVKDMHTIIRYNPYKNSWIHGC